MSSVPPRISFVADDAAPKVNFLTNTPHPTPAPKMLLYSLIVIFWPSDYLGPIETRHLCVFFSPKLSWRAGYGRFRSESPRICGEGARQPWLRPVLSSCAWSPCAISSGPGPRLPGPERQILAKQYRAVVLTFRKPLTILDISLNSVFGGCVPLSRNKGEHKPAS